MENLNLIQYVWQGTWQGYEMQVRLQELSSGGWQADVLPVGSSLESGPGVATGRTALKALKGAIRRYWGLREPLGRRSGCPLYYTGDNDGT